MAKFEIPAHKKTLCDRCGKEDVREVGGYDEKCKWTVWRYGRVTQPGGGYNGPAIEKDLCPECSAEVEICITSRSIDSAKDAIEQYE